MAECTEPSTPPLRFHRKPLGLALKIKTCNWVLGGTPPPIHSSPALAEGVGALWTGLGPNIARNAIINAAELASYDQIKESLLK